MKVGPVPACLVLGAAAATALLADHVASVAAIVAALLLVVLRAPARGKRMYVVGALSAAAGVLVVWPFFAVVGTHVLWSGPSVPVLGTLDVTREEIVLAVTAALRLAGVALAFTAYALLVDHDRLLRSVRLVRRSAFAAVLATRLVPTLERDASGLAEAMRGRGLPVRGARARAALVSPLVAGSLERALNLAEAMEARGFGRPGATRLPSRSWTLFERAAVVGGGLLVAAGVLWL